MPDKSGLREGEGEGGGGVDKKFWCSLIITLMKI